MADLNAFINWCIETCNKDNVGYSQTYRNQQTVNGITYYDCSSFVNYGLLAGGFTTPGYAPDHNAFTTYTETGILLGLGFEEVPISGEWKAGDIVWRSTHTEVVYSGGSGQGITMGAHTSHTALARQVSINSYTSNARNFSKLFRYSGGGGSEPVKPSQKVSMYVIAAMCGNFMQESQINPGVWEGLKKRPFTAINAGCGIGQWTNTGGDTHGRLYKMSRYCAQHGGVYNGDAQCGYILEENVWLNNDTSYGYNSLSDFLSSTSTDLEALTHAWNINWEGIHDGSWNARVEYARLCLNYLTDHAGDQITWTSVNNWITQSEQLNNCVAVYQYFNSDGSGINPDPVKPVDDGTHRVTIIGTGGGSAGASPELAKEGTEISYHTSADSTEYTFERWVVQWPPSLSLSGYSGTFTMPGTDVVARAQYSGGTAGPYSDTTLLYVIVTGYVKAEIMVETQDGGRVTHTITFDSNQQKVYTYDIGISDPVHITVNAGTTVSPVTRYVPGWTDDSENLRYFYFQPNIGVTLNMIGQPATDTLRKRKYKWWQYMRPVWTW